MKRRAFLTRLGAIAGGVVALAHQTPAAHHAPIVGAGPFAEETWAYGKDGSRFRYIRATHPLYEADLVGTSLRPWSSHEDGPILGVAVNRIAPGQCGWVQVCGPCGLRVLA